MKILERKTKMSVASLTNGIQELEDRILDTGDKIKEVYTSVKEILNLKIPGKNLGNLELWTD